MLINRINVDILQRFIHYQIPSSSYDITKWLYFNGNQVSYDNMKQYHGCKDHVHSTGNLLSHMHVAGLIDLSLSNPHSDFILLGEYILNIKCDIYNSGNMNALCVRLGRWLDHSIVYNIIGRNVRLDDMIDNLNILTQYDSVKLNHTNVSFYNSMHNTSPSRRLNMKIGEIK